MNSSANTSTGTASSTSSARMIASSTQLPPVAGDDAERGPADRADQPGRVAIQSTKRPPQSTRESTSSPT